LYIFNEFSLDSECLLSLSAALLISVSEDVVYDEILARDCRRERSLDASPLFRDQGESVIDISSFRSILNLSSGKSSYLWRGALWGRDIYRNAPICRFQKK
jgi:hypothetical protein